MQARRVTSLDVSRSIGSSGSGGGATTTLARHARQVAAMRTRSHSHGTRRAIEDMTPGGRSAQDELEVGAMESRDWGVCELLMAEARRKTTKFPFVLEEGSQAGFIAD